MEEKLIIYLLLAHWVADFVFQDEYWALNKSKSWTSLLMHTWVYSAVMTGFFLPILWEKLFLFFLACFITHTLIDYFTSRIVAKRFQNKYLGGPIPNLGAFSVIGFDQFLHYVTLILILSYLL